MIKPLQSITKYTLAFFLCFIATQGLADQYKDEYEMRSNANLELCHEFKAYLDRHLDKPLYCGLIADEEFEDFRLPVMKDAPPELGDRLWIQGTALFKGGRESQVQKMQITLDQIKETKDIIQYQTARMDINHDGEIDDLLIRTFPSTCEDHKVIKSLILPYDSNHNLKFVLHPSFSSYSVNGYPFYFKGRVYLLSGSNRQYTVFEPGGNESVMSSGPGVCTYVNLHRLKERYANK